LDHLGATELVCEGRIATGPLRANEGSEAWVCTHTSKESAQRPYAERNVVDEFHPNIRVEPRSVATQMSNCKHGGEQAQDFELTAATRRIDLGTW
jgi:hypothetical protein